MFVVFRSAFDEINSGSEKYSYADLFTLFIERGCDVNATRLGSTVLHLAVIEKQEILVRKLLISGAEIDRRDEYGFTPLFYACRRGSQRFVDLLIIAGAKLCTQNWRNNLIISGNEESIKMLIYINDKSKQCHTLENLCYISIRKRLQNVERDAFQLGLPPLLIRRLQLKDCSNYVG
ncbi:ankyrin repeat and SOCS box protein 14-like [Stegodyphus dumicola]|uniref:ankyrin repeat and SOCS box protein 14-like n=1 Tax=Stegodyphus dumicola TaxID=202533 RepID=UPI0015B2366F|nr:ankyrin repeat and SOCS box protein 14-like [Stegodyphus dumicola]